MALPPQKFREMVFQMLFSCDFDAGKEEEIAPMMMHELKVTRKAAQTAYERVQSILEKLPEIDERIAKASSEYQFERISTVEKNLLRLSLFELFYDQAIPWKVSIAEAVRLCRKFGTPESADFVNAILDSIYSSSQSCCTVGNLSEENS